ncbi:MAG: exodeoxyribonuclease VII large subunit, partial [Desulfobacterales bacterium]
LPKKICIITSPTGAVIHDILNIIDRRFAGIYIEIIPVKVQGFEAEKEIIAAIDMMNTRSDAGVAILARGGGSLEDFHAFNSEDVARAIFASKIPIISAIGHETDFSIADFAADLRAPTPSTAAELVVPVKRELLQKHAELRTNLIHRFNRYIENRRINISDMSKRLIGPQKRIEYFRLQTDDLAARLIRIFKNFITQQRERLVFKTEQLLVNSPQSYIDEINNKLEQINDNLLIFMSIYLNNQKYLLREVNARLYALNPNAILERGYSITRTMPEAIVVRDPREVGIGQDLEVTVAKGKLICRVKGK